MFFIDKIIFLSSVLSLTNINIMLMKRIIHYFVASAALLFCWTSTEAQVVMKLPETNKVAKSDAGQMQKAEPAKSKSENMSTAYKSPWPLQTFEEKIAYTRFIKEKSNVPTLIAPIPYKTSAKAESEILYTYTGFNAGAGLDENGNATGGMVNFNLTPFACDTVS